MVSSPVSSNLHSQIHLHLEKLLMLSHFLCYNISHHIPLMLQLFNSHLMVGGGGKQKQETIIQLLVLLTDLKFLGVSSQVVLLCIVHKPSPVHVNICLQINRGMYLV